MAVGSEVKANAVVDALNKQIANWGVLHIKLHNYHWFVSGDQFFALHSKFEELYNAASDWLDELAERVLALRGKPIATLKEMLALATVSEATGSESTAQMVATTAQDFQRIARELTEGIEQADQAGDHVTSDLLTGIQQALEKHVWMLESFNR
ncbi:MAG: Ferritin Dps family protein [Paenibacillus sp.]|jgi:starvation-inducible DNA-binding protein|nr:Ferritin Dps family protein [Paenibacillus sp.]